MPVLLLQDLRRDPRAGRLAISGLELVGARLGRTYQLRIVGVMDEIAIRGKRLFDLSLLFIKRRGVGERGQTVGVRAPAAVDGRAVVTQRGLGVARLFFGQTDAIVELDRACSRRTRIECLG